MKKSSVSDSLILPVVVCTSLKCCFLVSSHLANQPLGRFLDLVALALSWRCQSQCFGREDKGSTLDSPKGSVAPKVPVFIVDVKIVLIDNSLLDGHGFLVPSSSSLGSRSGHCHGHVQLCRGSTGLRWTRNNCQGSKSLNRAPREQKACN